MAENNSNNVIPFRQRVQNQQDENVSREEQDNYNNNVEELRRYALMENRAQRKGAEEVRDISLQVKPPGKFRYTLGFVYAILLDLLDVVEDIADLSGVGIILTIVIDFILDLPLLWLGFKSSKELKKMGKSSSVVGEKIAMIEQKIATYRSRYAMALKASRKFKSLRKPVRVAARKLKTARKVITKSPVGRYIFAMVADLIPFVDIIPFRTWGIYSSYKQEKKAYQEFLLLISQDYPEALAEEDVALNEMLEAEQETARENLEERQLAA